ncbi:metallopeptidase family protein [Actinotalea sp. M2MS4P-6]|uniref:metallopeptidase family protein n=1 Tax=Actinotalea sp. M2MS4P-6 TaxID=2983762 RepID=UPI0021E38181|nr:metallopeptidase family protein [Actinotalea sp. M2MS4P-6]MCV2394728.1 metallopeptidase family protein [Actinotalea sp. M2MS4P-6]
MSPVRMTSEEFEGLVTDALDALPEWTTPLLDEIAVLVRDEPEPGTTRPGVTLLGQYRGIPATAHGGRVPGSIPDTITLFRLPILAACRSREEVPARVLTVLGHEVGHAMGISERELRELGWF